MNKTPSADRGIYDRHLRLKEKIMSKTKNEQQVELIVGLADRFIAALEALVQLQLVQSSAEVGGKAASGKAAASKSGKAASKTSTKDAKEPKPKKVTKPQLKKIKEAVTSATELEKDDLLKILKEEFEVEAVAGLDSSQVEDFIIAIGTANLAAGGEGEGGGEDDPLAGI